MALACLPMEASLSASVDLNLCAWPPYRPMSTPAYPKPCTRRGKICIPRVLCLVNAPLTCLFFHLSGLWQPSITLCDGLPSETRCPSSFFVCQLEALMATHLRYHISQKPSSHLRPHCAASDPQVVGCILKTGCILLFWTERSLQLPLLRCRDKNGQGRW